MLATSQYLLLHRPKNISPNNRATNSNSTSTHQQCSHYFLDPLSWMKAELEQGKLDGRLECPKCGANVGKYAWQGMRCSCSEWIVPGISLARGKVDEVRSRVTTLAHGLQPQQEQQEQQEQQQGANVMSGGPDSYEAAPRAQRL